MSARGTTLFMRLVDRAVANPKAHQRVAALRRAHPHATSAELIARLDKRYLRRVALLGGGVGAVAAVPAVGTGTALLLTSSQVAAFLSASAGYVMAVASVHGVKVDDVERRRTLLLAALLGEDGAHAVSEQVGLGTLYWGKAALTKLPIGTVKAVNRMLTRRLVRTGATRGGALLLGRLAPFGIGAVIGYRGTRAMGRNVVEGTRDAFGPAPAMIIEAQPA
ncbi:hypothetical protein [Georgenia sp. SYP-B2076]|uniref:hypothetical protein n=1 Tax=Georgenia sp. SYP-B2076 TaxID=2495881 RepID=UPI000F8D1DB2|nr:hypothetical protein [Georgenia sp. SYP-B2076]